MNLNKVTAETVEVKWKIEDGFIRVQGSVHTDSEEFEDEIYGVEVLDETGGGSRKIGRVEDTEVRDGDLYAIIELRGNDNE